MSPTPTYPRIVYIHDAGTPGYKAVEVADADAEKALGVPVFDTAERAAAFNAPIEQPISHIVRTQNEEQFVPGRSQLGSVPGAVLQTPPPVRNVYLTTTVDPDSLTYKAKLPDGVDPSILKDQPVEGGPTP